MEVELISVHRLIHKRCNSAAITRDKRLDVTFRQGNYDRCTRSIILGETRKIHVKQAGVTRRNVETVISYRGIVVCY